MIKIAVVGAGKMGISHLSILGAHKDVQVVGVCDTSKMVIDVLKKYSRFPVFSDYEKMIAEVKPDAVVISVPTRFHAPMVKKVMDMGIHIFVEKPFCMSAEEGLGLVKLAESRKLINQVGYHNKFVGTFNEVKRLIDATAIGEISHFTGEAYGPVVTKPKSSTWRSDPGEGGGCLMDYASHVIDLINFLISPIKSVEGSLLKSMYSTSVDDSVYSLLKLENNVTGVLSVNWSDITYRKMSTSITIIGTKGKIITDANELKVHFEVDKCPPGYSKGWNIKYLTDLTNPVDFYLRGEEYSSQLDYFIDTLLGRKPNSVNTFYSAWQTDHAISLIKQRANLN